MCPSLPRLQLLFGLQRLSRRRHLRLLQLKRCLRRLRLRRVRCLLPLVRVLVVDYAHQTDILLDSNYLSVSFLRTCVFVYFSVFAFHTIRPDFGAFLIWRCAAFFNNLYVKPSSARSYQEFIFHHESRLYFWPFFCPAFYCFIILLFLRWLYFRADSAVSESCRQQQERRMTENWNEEKKRKQKKQTNDGFEETFFF